MRRLRSFVSPIVYDLPTGTLAIATGLSILAVAMIFPGSPAVTGMALVVLGATCATRARFRGNTAILSIMLVHLFTYGSLYVLFVGSALDAGARSGAALAAIDWFDLALSICPLAFALEQMWCELHTGRTSE
jgi:hypothetical protein